MPEVQRLIVVANRTCPCPGLTGEIRSHLGAGRSHVRVVAPALNSRLKHYLSDSDQAYRRAAERLGIAVGLLRDAGIDGSGEVGDADPLIAVEDTLAEFPARAVLISTWPEGRSHWLERDLLSRARERFDVPVHHVVSRYDAAVAA